MGARGRKIAAGRRHDPQDKVARLVAAAATVIGERGLGGATVPRISARAGVSRGLVHYHFPNVAALVHAVARRHHAEWEGILRAATVGSAGAAEQAREVVTAARALAAQMPGFWALRAALLAGAHQDETLADILAGGHRAAAAIVGPVDPLVCGFAIRPEARALDTHAWDRLERAAVAVAQAAAAEPGP